MDSKSKARSQVLVVGAGPVGLVAALRLRSQGIEVRIVDQQSELRAHSFPVVLHPRSLRLLSELGVAAALFWRGRPVTRLAVYTEYERRAVLDLPSGGIAPGALTLPQDIVRQALLHQLAELGVTVEWNTRLAVLQQDEHAVWGRLVREDPARLLLSASRLEVSAFEADFVVGADGYDSSVREALGIELVDHGGLQTFAFFDAVTQRAGTEAQLALSDEYCNSVYPLQGGHSRFSFQVSRGLDRAPDGSALRELISARLPWYGEDIIGCEWGGIAEFRRALVTHYGSGRVWLAGEAAHLTGPIGVQSINVGLDEADELGRRIAHSLQQPSEPPFGPHYEARRLRQWRELLGLSDRAALTERSPSWTRRSLHRLLPCLPASGADLDDLLQQLRLTLVSSAPPAQPG
jgi:2-polyprenyl-6-methoxyphenol hydroxylase-like FAD-dependent oxidoreductase